MKLFGIRSMLLGTLLSATLLWPGFSAFALSEKEVITKLNTIPTFSIVDSKGKPLLLTAKADKNVAYLNFYLDIGVAQRTMEVFQAQNASVAKNYRIGLVSLGQAYTVVKEQSKKKDNKLRFQFLSSSKDLSVATQLAQKKDPNLKNFVGVPLFFVSGGTDPKKQGILTLKKDGKEYLPMFFSEEDLQKNLVQLKQSGKELPKDLSIQVATLDAIVSTMLGGKNDADAEKITFVPSKAALQYVQKLQKSAPKPKS
jgi:ribosome assembly protein YihI (activator of Der GTPase)